MFKGKVVWFSSQKGFGFVRRDSDGAEFFAHFSQILADGYKKLDVDDVVEFSVGEGPNGKQQAEQIQVLQKAVA